METCQIFKTFACALCCHLTWLTVLSKCKQRLKSHIFESTYKHMWDISMLLLVVLKQRKELEVDTNKI